MKNTVNIGRAALFIAGTAVIAILAAALLIFLSVKADKAENEKDYIPFIGTTELPEVIAVDDSHEYRRRLVSNWRISEIQSGRAAVEDINKEHPRVVGADENMGISDLDGNMILPAEYRDATITDAGCLKTWAKGGGRCLRPLTAGLLISMNTAPLSQRISSPPRRSRTPPACRPAKRPSLTTASS